MGSNLPPYKVGNLNSKLFLSEISKREKSLKRMLEGRKPTAIQAFYCLMMMIVIISNIYIFINKH